jgi:enterochelin esterase-like enzyme
MMKIRLVLSLAVLAIAGLSMGWLQAMGAGVGHVGYFSLICAFSPVPFVGYRQRVQQVTAANIVAYR